MLIETNISNSHHESVAKISPFSQNNFIIDINVKWPSGPGTVLGRGQAGAGFGPWLDAIMISMDDIVRDGEDPKSVPDFSRYSEPQLRQILTRLDGARFPQRVAAIEAQLMRLAAAPDQAPPLRLSLARPQQGGEQLVSAFHRRLPGLMVGLMLVWLGYLLLVHGPSLALLMPCLVGVVFLGIVIGQREHYLDAVLDHGTVLELRKGELIDVVALHDVVSVDLVRDGEHYWSEVRLLTPGVLGQSVRFIPPLRLADLAGKWPQRYGALNARIAAARRMA